MRTSSISLAAISLVIGLFVRAEAQIDVLREGPFQAYQLIERGVVVGEVVRVDRDPTHYAEHYVLYPGYIYPSPTNGVAVEIRPGGARYRDLADFFARVPFEKGSRYVFSDCYDGASLPR